MLITKAFRLNPAVRERQYWLADPELKSAIDELVLNVSELIELSEGGDARLYDMAGPILDYFQISLPTQLLNVCAKYVDQMEAAWPEVAARVRSIKGDSSALPSTMKSRAVAQSSNGARTTWCQECLDSENIELQDAILFTRLAKPEELERWLALDRTISGAGDMVTSVISLLARSQVVVHSQDFADRYQLGLQVDEFIVQFGVQVNKELSICVLVELAEGLFDAELPQKALALTSLMLPEGNLWPSPFVMLHLKCLLQTEQYHSFDELCSRIPDVEGSISLMNYRSMKEEALGNSECALMLSDQMIRFAPDNLSCWLRGCALRERFRDVEEQRHFHDSIPEHLLESFSHEAMVAMRFITSGGNFKRAEPRLVRWFIEAPSARAVMLVNFHFGHAWRRQAGFEVSPDLPGQPGGVEFEQDGRVQVRLIVEEGEVMGQYVLSRGTQLANLLESLEVGQSAPLGMVTYKLLARLPPYVACIRLASQLRHLQNDGSDVFAILQIPDDPTQLVSYLEQKLGSDRIRGAAGRVKDIPLFIQGHALQSDNPIKAALNAWSDSTVPKSLLLNEGITHPDEVVLDAYSIAYLAMTNVVERLIDAGITFILPAETKVLLQRWVVDVTREDFLMMGVNGAGRLIRTTASDIRVRDGHTLRGMQRILDEAVVSHPVIHDTELELYSIKDGIDITVYLAMQLSSANDLPWFCMDFAFAGLHNSKGYKVANVNSILLRTVDTPDFDFEEKRHGLLLFALGAIPRALTHSDVKGLAANPSPLSSFILNKIFQNHGYQIFVENNQQGLLLYTLITHVVCTFYQADNPATLAPEYTPWCRYDEHVFNHGLRLFITNRSEKSAEFWVAVALKTCLQIIHTDTKLARYTINLFCEFVSGHFLDLDAVAHHYEALER